MKRYGEVDVKLKSHLFDDVAPRNPSPIVKVRVGTSFGFVTQADLTVASSGGLTQVMVRDTPDGRGVPTHFSRIVVADSPSPAA